MGAVSNRIAKLSIFDDCTPLISIFLSKSVEK